MAYWTPGRLTIPSFSLDIVLQKVFDCIYFLWNIKVGRPAFDEFTKKYIATFKFKSIDTDTFLEFLKANLPGIEKEIDLILWTEGTGIPPDAYEPVSSIYTKIVSMANEFKLGRMPMEDEVADWGGMEWELYLENLPKSIEASQVVLWFFSSTAITLPCFLWISLYWPSDSYSVTLFFSLY